MSLLHLPTELILAILNHVDHLHDLNALIQTCSHLHEILNSTLYSLEAQSGAPKALHYAALHNLPRTARLSLAQNTNINVLTAWKRGTESTTPHPSMVQIAGLTPLQIAVSEGHEEVACLLIRRGVNVKLRYPIPFGNTTVLHVASSAGMVETVKLLLEHRADVQAGDCNGRTALHAVVVAPNSSTRVPEARRRVEVVRLLLEWGAEPGIGDKRGLTPVRCCELSVEARACRLSERGGREAMAAEVEILELLRAKRASFVDGEVDETGSRGVTQTC